MADLKNYDPFEILMAFRGIPLIGPMDGTFVTVERAEDAFSMAVGAHGDVTRVRSRNRTGSVTVTIKAESPTNDLLSAIAAEDELLGTGVGPILIKNALGTTICDAPVAWIRKVSNVEYGDEASGREWVFDCGELNMFVGGSAV